MHSRVTGYGVRASDVAVRRGCSGDIEPAMRQLIGGAVIELFGGDGTETSRRCQIPLMMLNKKLEFSPMTKPQTVELRVLSVKQPWADCLMHDKWVENRTWETQYRGPLWIQAGLKTDYGPDGEAEYRNVPGERLQSHIIGRVELLDCALQSDLIAVWNFINGHRKTLTTRQEELRVMAPRSNAKKWKYVNDVEYCWIVGNPRLLKVPIPCPGKLKIFKFEADPESLKLKRRTP